MTDTQNTPPPTSLSSGCRHSADRDQASIQPFPGEEGGVATGPKSRQRSNRARLGRSGPRSRLGCVTCKQRRVRCDEVHPICGHCRRLQLTCYYQPALNRWRRREVTGFGHCDDGQGPRRQRQSESGGGHIPGPAGAFHAVNGGSFENPQPIHQVHQDLDGFTAGTQSSAHMGQNLFDGAYDRLEHAPANQYNNTRSSWTLARSANFNDIFSDFDTSWAGQMPCVLPDGQASHGNGHSPGLYHFGPVDDTLPPNDGASLPNSSAFYSGTTPGIQNTLEPQLNQLGMFSEDMQTPSSHAASKEGTTSTANEDPAHLFQLFSRIHQPPAAILIGGYERWRRLRHYLCKLSEHSRAVNNSLLCVIEFLMIDEMVAEEGQSREICMKRILERHTMARQEIERRLSKRGELKLRSRETLLAAIFLLGWFEVIRDQDMQPILFPRQLADKVIIVNSSWNRYSRQLLSWLNTLDSKATHLGREHLLAPAALNVVSNYHTEITSSLQQDGCVDRLDYDSDDSDLSSLGADSPIDSSPSYNPQESLTLPKPLQLGQVKQSILNTIVQPALAWHLTSQSYCRRISAHDKHHRRRFTSDDEYDVITACKQIETELFELWHDRPAVMCIPEEQLKAVMSPEIATRLEEIFSIYSASFWILFVYLHRTSWWHLPHSALVKRALAEVWHHMQRAYGEEVNGPLRRVIHPSLLWPLFLFGTECQGERQRVWAFKQLEALGEAKPVVETEVTGTDNLPPFKLSSGATRNATRAAALLKELIKQQDETKQRVDDRDLSMRMFGCYFSIV